MATAEIQIGVESVTIFLNGRKIDLQQAGSNERIGLANRLYKYTPLSTRHCAQALSIRC